MDLNPLDFLWVWLNWYVYQVNLTTTEHFIDQIEFFMEIQFDQKIMDGPEGRGPDCDISDGDNQMVI